MDDNKTDTRWQALKSYLRTQVDQDLAVAESFKGTQTGAAHFSLVSANRSTLAKMRELEAGNGGE